MCGICGIWYRNAAAPQDVELLDRMTDVLTHRGPDDRGTWHGERVRLGHRRLSVLDLSPAGRQPMANEDGTIQIAFNGEIYNFRELKARFQLAEKGHLFRSRTDTEVLVHLYEQLGPEMVRELDGMFAYALWDGRRRQLHLARDGFGIKPLFYTWHEDRFLFGSEIKALLQERRLLRRVNVQALHDYLTFDYVPGEQTAFAGIRELPPAHRMTIHADGQVELRRYFDIPFHEDDSISEADAVARTQELLDQAVRRQLVADVPVGVLLSGGLDSATLLALMARNTSAPVHTYSIGFQDASFNELPYARLAAQTFSAVPREVVITPDMVRDLLPKYIRYIDEPYADGSAIPTYYVCEQARGEVVVVLSGEGGDEAFAGYETHAAYKAASWIRRVPRWLRNGLVAPLVNLLPVSHKKLSLEFRLKRFIAGQDLPPAEAHLWWRIVFTEAQKLSLYSPAVLDQLRGGMPPERHFREVFGRSGARDVLNRLLHIDAAVFLPDDLMIKNDRMSMAHSLEARVPLTDLDLVRFLARVPARIKLPRLRKKHILRRAMAGILPPAILNKKKVGLEMPYSRWLTQELKDFLDRYCHPERIASTGLFRAEAVNSLVDEHLSHRKDHGRALWGLLNFMIWYEGYIA